MSTEVARIPKQICIVLPMFGKPELTDKCIELCRLNAGIEHDIVVVDDGSPEPYVNDTVNVLRLAENSGFTAATNAGVLWCSDKYKYIHFLNNDTEPRPDFLKILYDVLQNEENEVIGIAGSSRIVRHNGGEVYELVAADLISGYHTYVDQNAFEGLPQLIHAHWFPLCSALIRHSLIREIGLLDKRMRTWCSDNDFCVRANFAGWNTTLVPKSQVWHAQQGTTGKANLAGIKADQDTLMAKVMNVQYAVLMDKMPLDSGNGIQTWGKADFRVYKK